MERYFNRTLRRAMHLCGNGFKGNVVHARGVVFCGVCGKEFRK